MDRGQAEQLVDQATLDSLYVYKLIPEYDDPPIILVNLYFDRERNNHDAAQLVGTGIS